MAGKYPQPPGDAGSRKNLADRKGKVDRVEKAYVGIVNVYSLIPKGGGAVKIEEFNIPPAPPGTKIYPQSKPPKPPVSSDMLLVKPLTKAQKQKAEKEIRRINDQKSNAGRESFALIEDKHAKAFRLRKYIGEKADDWIEDIGVYENWVKNHPNNSRFEYISRNAGKHGKEIKDSREVKFAIAVLKKRQGTKDFERLLNREAMNLGVSKGKLMQWYHASSMNLDKVVNTTNKYERERIAHDEAEKKLIETSQKFRMPDIIDLPAPKVISVPTLAELPIPLGKQIRRISFSESNDRSKYLPLAPDQIRDTYREKPDSVAVREDGNTISYFIDARTISQQRKHKIMRANMKRPRYIFKISKRSNKVIKSNLIKKKIVGKIRCKCRRRK